MAKTKEQQLASYEQKAAKLRTQLAASKRKAENHRKVIVGGFVLAALRDDAEFRAFILPRLDKMLTRPADREPLADVLAQLPPQSKTDTPPPANG
jgi:hypothetical protein